MHSATHLNKLPKGSFKGVDEHSSKAKFHLFGGARVYPEKQVPKCAVGDLSQNTCYLSSHIFQTCCLEVTLMIISTPFQFCLGGLEFQEQTRINTFCFYSSNLDVSIKGAHPISSPSHD
ncbi:hypothetical protein DSO57_1017501 [Entomophthora muscae]|uniref:Uncharacterized protein n=1 Tax=Entomophthora muscae TaxID=34485 RepID=A0ACC2SHD4_9FUNG|nr:hypothetical protein DSO57_1017501 [Entomophthora muscae]